MSTETIIPTQLDNIGRRQYSAAYEAVRSNKMLRSTPRVTKDDRAVVLAARRDLDKNLELVRVFIERSLSIARAGQEGNGGDSLTYVSGGVRSPLDGRAAERSSERGEEAMKPATPVLPNSGGAHITELKKYSPRSPTFQLDMGRLTANAMKHAQRPATVEEIEATLRRGREEYLRRSPKNVPPPSDE